jgi:hypothetical protein
VGRNVETQTGSILATDNGGATWAVQKTGFGKACTSVAARRVFTPAAASTAGSVRGGVNGPSLALTWENGIVTTVYDVQNPQEATTPVEVHATKEALPARYGVQNCRSFAVTASLVFSGGAELAIPNAALPALDLPATLAPKLLAFTKSPSGTIVELPGRYDPATKKSTFSTQCLSTTFVLATDTTKPVAKALANAAVKRGKKASLRFKVADGRPEALVTITIAKGKQTKKTLRLGSRATNMNQVAAFVCQLPAGTFTYTVKATDRAGNVSSRTAACTRKLVVRP